MSNFCAWKPITETQAIVFDCDGTLSAIEGIDELAKLNNVADEVLALTEQAMGQTGINPELYRKRLELVYPEQKQVENLGQQYYSHQVPAAAQVIQTLQRLGKSVYLVSAGLYPAVSFFGNLLKIPKENIFAVGIEFDHEGRYINFDDASPLVYREGKREITTQLKKQYSSIAHIGDGMNDFVTKDLVTRFVGYGGVYYREHIATQCQFYIKTLSLAGLLPLLLTDNEYEQLLPAEQNLYAEGMQAINEELIICS